MATGNHQVLDNVAHSRLRVITDRSAWYGDDVPAALVFPIELRRLQSEYPIAIQKNAESGNFEPIAVFGFGEGENLFLGDDGWEAGYIPLSLERAPFLIGFATSSEDGVATEQPVVYVDMDSPRVSETEGVPVFLEHGGQSPYLEHINSVLNAIHHGYEANQRLAEALTQHDLIEPFALEIPLADGTKQTLDGLYTVHEEKLNALDADALASLHGDGHLESIYMMIASLENFRTLIDRKNARS